MEQKDYSKLISTTPPQGLVPWLENLGELDYNLLIHKIVWGVHPETGRKERMTQIKCTSCQGEVFAYYVDNTGFGSGKFINLETKMTIGEECPRCGCHGRLIHSSDLTKYRNTVQSYPVTISKIEDKLVIYCWYVEKHFYKDGKTEITTNPYEAYVIEKKKIIRLNAWKGTMNGVCKRLSGMWTQRKTFLDYLGIVNLIYPWNSDVLEGTITENSKLDLFLQSSTKVKPIQYLKLWQKYPNIENLVVQGAGYLLAEMMDSHSMNQLNDIKMKETRPTEMLGIEKPDFKKMVSEQWDIRKYLSFRLLKQNNLQRTREHFAYCEQLGEYACHSLMTKTQNPIKVAKYLEKQHKKDNRCDYKFLEDYWRMAIITEYDIENQSILFPQQLYQAHNRVMDIAKKEEIKTYDKQLKKRFQFLSQFTWENDELLIRPVMSGEELKAEGDKLRHCVYTYAKSIATGKTAIFFIRKKSSPDEPFFTLELDETNLTIKQNRGKCNCNTTEEITVFELAWLEHISSLKVKTKSPKGGTAA